MPKLAITRRPIVLETQAPASLLTDILARIEGVVGRAYLYGVTDPVAAKLFASESVEADFTTGYYRNGFAADADPSALPGWSFARTGLGTAETLSGQVVTFASGVPRVTDRGLLIENASTNVLLHSAKVTNPAWTVAGGATTDANYWNAPDGTAADVVFLTNTEGSRIQQSVGASPAVEGETWTGSVWAFGTGTMRLNVGSSTGTGGETDNQVTLSAIPQRFQVSHTFTAGASGGVRFMPALHRSGDTATLVFLWGAQLEKAPAATSYIPTTGAAATRGADAVTISSTKGPKGLIFAEVITPDGFSGPPGIVGAATVTPLALTATGVDTFNGSDVVRTGDVTPGEILTAGVSWREHWRAVTFDGLAALVDSGSVGNWSELQLGSNLGAALNGYLRRVLISSRDVPPAQLQAMTL